MSKKAESYHDLVEQVSISDQNDIIPTPPESDSEVNDQSDPDTLSDSNSSGEFFFHDTFSNHLDEVPEDQNYEAGRIELLDEDIVDQYYEHVEVEPIIEHFDEPPNVLLRNINGFLPDRVRPLLVLPIRLEPIDEETSDEMALHESPLLRPPQNSPAAQSLNNSQATLPTAPFAEMEEDMDSDEFEDSVEQQIQSMDLYTALADCERAITLFFTNRLEQAIAIMNPWRETSLYHAHGATILEFIPAMLTLEPAQLQRAKDALEHTLTLCAQLRRNFTLVQSIGAIIKTPNYAGYSEEEAHAELVHAEAWLLSACLGIIENEDMTGVVRASLRVKASYNEYKNCAKILAKKTWDNEESRAHFESGVRLGLATFDVMISMLPPRIVTLLQFVGFSADKEQGKSELTKAAQSPGLRSVLCELTLLVYYLVIGHFAAIPPDFEAAEKIISKSLKKYPDSIWFLMFKARVQLLRGKALDAIETYQKTCRMMELWPQIKHLAYWELVWAFAMKGHWSNAADYAGLLEQESKWSRTIYMYAQAAMLIQTSPETPEVANRIADFLLNAASYRQRLLGRSLPMEKFVLQRCERWARRGYLVLPGIEWLCLWNIFPALAADSQQADAILRIIERKCHTIRNSLQRQASRNNGPLKEMTDKTVYDEDDLALGLYLRGSLLNAMSLPRQGMGYLDIVIQMKDKIQEHKFLLPYTTVEIAQCYYQLGDPMQAVALLQKARKKYSGYLLEARLHFRIHSKLQYISAGINYVARNLPERGSITGADRYAAMRAAPKPSTSKTNEASKKPNDKLEENSKNAVIVDVPGPSSEQTSRDTEPSYESVLEQSYTTALEQNYEPVAGPSYEPIAGPSSESLPATSQEPVPRLSYEPAPQARSEAVPGPSYEPVAGPSSAPDPVPCSRLHSNENPTASTSYSSPSTTYTSLPMTSTNGASNATSKNTLKSNSGSAAVRVSPSIEMDLIAIEDPEANKIEMVKAEIKKICEMEKS